eukprot:17931-Heterococcus_DN1.PRE.1
MRAQLISSFQPVSSTLNTAIITQAMLQMRVLLIQDYNKAHSVTAMKANPLGGSSMAKGIVLEKM